MNDNLIKLFELIDVNHLVSSTRADVSVIGDSSIIIFNGYNKIVKVNYSLGKIFVTVFSSNGGTTAVDENSLISFLENELKLKISDQ